MNLTLLKPSEVDLLFRYPSGRSLRLAKAGLIPHIVLPGGEIRFDQARIEAILARHVAGQLPEDESPLKGPMP